LYRDRQQLAQLIQAAGTNGARFNDEALFQERSNLLKKHLGGDRGQALTRRTCHQANQTQAKPYLKRA
jgi:hypothetical protein